jgi:hypothetical protein
MKTNSFAWPVCGLLASRLDLEAEGGVEAASHFEVGHLKNNTI